MADESKTGILGRLPPLPRPALNNSVIGMEQAYRQRKGLTLLTDADMEALKAGQPMSWEEGGTPAPPAAPSTPAAATPASSASAAVVAAPAAPAASGGTISEEVAKWVAQGNKWSKSTIAAEQARRGRKALAALTDAEVAALLGEPAAAETPAAAPVAAAVARPGAAAVRPAAGPPSAAATVSRGGASNTYVGTPAVGTSRAAASAGVASVGPDDNAINQGRRRFAWAAFAAFMTAWFIAFFRFFLPRTLFEPATSFKIGYPADFGLGVDTKFQQKYRIWVDRTPDRIFVIYARCTHLGCTPDWKPAENKFKCPCHGSGYDSEGINFEGPAPRPMDRAKVEIAPDGQILVDVSKLYQWPKGQPTHFNDPGAFLPT
ncbi:MAG: ubiquinol-cytochrome c reductase iron-sulfur subunit [Terriglobales bacterium]